MVVCTLSSTYQTTVSGAGHKAEGAGGPLPATRQPAARGHRRLRNLVRALVPLYHLCVMEELSVNYLEDLLRSLTERGVRFVIAGGVAVVLHGIERTTMDLDIALDLSPENVRRFADAVEALGLCPLVPVPVQALSDPEIVRMMVDEKHAIVFMLADPAMPLRKIDVFLTEPLSYQNLMSDSVAVDIPGMPLRVVSLRRLLALKQAVDPPRDKDLFDIQAIESRLRKGEPHG